MGSDIKLCVRCGSEAECQPCSCVCGRYPPTYSVVCTNCGMTGEVCESYEDAIELWNAITLEAWMED